MSDQHAKDALARVYADLQSGALTVASHADADAFVRHYGASKRHESLVRVTASINFHRGGFFEETCVLPPTLLDALRYSDPELCLGEVNGKHSEVVRRWSELVVETDDDYYAVMEAGGNCSVPYWIEQANDAIRHATHVRLDFRRVPLLMASIDEWRLSPSTDIVIPRTLWQRIKATRGTAVEYRHWIQHYLDLYHGSESLGDDEEYALRCAAAAQLEKLGVPESLSLEALMGGDDDDSAAMDTYEMITDVVGTDPIAADYEYWNDRDDAAIHPEWCHEWLRDVLLRKTPAKRARVE